MIQIDSNFPGGNIAVDRIEGDTIYLHPDQRDTVGGWFYWALRLRGAAGRKLNFIFEPWRAVGMTGPALSYDGGLTWQWQNHDFSPDRFTISIPAHGDDLLLAVSFVYTQANWERFIATLSPSPVWQLQSLCQTRKGRNVELLQLGCEPGHGKRHVVFTARHHCCEVIASYALEGVISALLADTPAAAALRHEVSFTIIPFADKDGVEAGDQGKNRAPRDHNRDYKDESLYAETAAIRKLLGGWAETHGITATFDLHCPALIGSYESQVYQVGREYPRHWAAQQRFGSLLEAAVSPDGLPYRASNDLPFGVGWNVARNFSGGFGFTRWSGDLPGILLATTFEIPYGTAGGVEVSVARARRFGHDLVAALANWLAEQE